MCVNQKTEKYKQKTERGSPAITIRIAAKIFPLARVVRKREAVCSRIVLIFVPFAPRTALGKFHFKLISFYLFCDDEFIECVISVLKLFCAAGAE